MDGAHAVLGLEGAVEDRQVLGLEAGRALDRLVLGEVGEDRVDLVRRVAELAEGRRDRLVDDLQEALADELLVLDEGDVRLNAGGIAVHHEGDGPGGRQDGDLGVPVAVLLAELEGLVEDLPGGVLDVGRDARAGDVVRGVAVLPDDPQERVAVDVVLEEGATVVAGDDARLAVGLAVHDRGQGGSEVPALVGVIGQAAAHEERAEVRVAQPEGPELVGVLLDAGRRVGRVVDEDLLGGQGQGRRIAIVLDVELAVLAHELHEVQ